MSSDLLANALLRDPRWQAIAVDPQNLLHQITTTGADLVIISSDLSEESGNCYELVQQVTRTLPTASVVVLLKEVSREAILHAFRSGARGVFSRQQPMTEFLSCIEHVARGFIWAGRSETDFLLEAFKSTPALMINATANTAALSARELQVVKCAAAGKTNRGIAAELWLSEHTVKNYLFKAFEKLGVSNRVELLFYLTSQGHLLSTPESPKTEMRTKD